MQKINLQKLKLPLTIDPIREAQRRIDLKGIYVAKYLPRLQEATEKLLSDVTATFSFFIDVQKLAVMKGEAQVDVELVCQRCGNRFVYPLKCEMLYSPVKNVSQIDELPEIYEPAELDAFGEINLLTLVEDELIVSLPLVPKHKYEHCEVSFEEQVFGVIPTEEEKENPFAILASLKKK